MHGQKNIKKCSQIMACSDDVVIIGIRVKDVRVVFT